VETDLNAEGAIQMGVGLVIAHLSELSQLGYALDAREGGRVRAIWIDEWSSELVATLDTHVVRLERTGAQFLFITSAALADRLLTEAPNFRSRLTEMLRIVPDPAIQGAS
jgi:hypothetical protein